MKFKIVRGNAMLRKLIFLCWPHVLLFLFTLINMYTTFWDVHVMKVLISYTIDVTLDLNWQFFFYLGLFKWHIAHFRHEKKKL